MNRVAKKAAQAVSPKKQLAEFIAKFDPANAKLIRQCRAEIRQLLPTANEVVYDNYNFFVIGYCTTERPSDCMVSLVANASGVGLSFYYGATLPDPQHLLLGSGNQNRFIRLPSVETLRSPGVPALIQAAIAQADPAPSARGGGQIIIRCIAARQRPRRKPALSQVKESMKKTAHTLLIGLIAFIFATARAEDNEAAKADKARLQGEWTLVSGERDGDALPSAITNDSKRVAQGDEITVTIQGKLLMKAKFTLDAAKAPKTIDYSVTGGPLAGSTQLGIYELDGDTAKFCFSIPGQERPANFLTKPGDGRTMSVWKKKEINTNHMSAPIVYFEIAGPDGAKLKDFYSAVLGWTIDDHAGIAAASTGGLKGGLRQDPAEKVLYFGVPDINAALKHIEESGGKTVVPRTVVPGVVTFALFTDPAGNRLGLAEFGSYPK